MTIAGMPVKNYPHRKFDQVALDYVKEHCSTQTIISLSKTLNLHRMTLYRHMLKYGFECLPSGRWRAKNLPLIAKVIEDYMENGMSIKIAAKMNNVSQYTVSRYIRKHYLPVYGKNTRVISIMSKI